MIVRISGLGQYELDDDAVRKLDQLDVALTEALHSGNADTFHAKLRETVDFVRHTGKVVEDARVVPSDVIVPPEDISLAEAQNFFTDEGLIAPLPA